MSVDLKAAVVKVEDNSPLRCQAVNAKGQCNNQKVEGSDYCIVHGGNKGGEKLAKARADKYRLGKYRARLHELGSNEPKNLRDEIGILRILIEEFMHKIERETDGVLLYSGRVADIISRLEKVVRTCHSIDIDSGRMMDKHQALNFAVVISDLITESIEEVLKQIRDDSSIKLQNDDYSKIVQILQQVMIDVLIGKISESLATINDGTTGQ